MEPYLTHNTWWDPIGFLLPDETPLTAMHPTVNQNELDLVKFNASRWIIRRVSSDAVPARPFGEYFSLMAEVQ